MKNGGKVGVRGVNTSSFTTPKNEGVKEGKRGQTLLAVTRDAGQLLQLLLERGHGGAGVEVHVVLVVAPLHDDLCCGHCECVAEVVAQKKKKERKRKTVSQSSSENRNNEKEQRKGKGKREDAQWTQPAMPTSPRYSKRPAR